MFASVDFRFLAFGLFGWAASWFCGRDFRFGCGIGRPGSMLVGLIVVDTTQRSQEMK